MGEMLTYNMCRERGAVVTSSPVYLAEHKRGSSVQKNWLILRLGKVFRTQNSYSQKVLCMKQEIPLFTEVISHRRAITYQHNQRGGYFYSHIEKYGSRPFRKVQHVIKDSESYPFSRILIIRLIFPLWPHGGNAAPGTTFLVQAERKNDEKGDWFILIMEKNLLQRLLPTSHGKNVYVATSS